MIPWRERPPEERFAVNPALTALILHHAAAGYTQQNAGGLPFHSSFLIVPTVLHRPTREALPAGIRTTLPAWLPTHPVEREAVRTRIPVFAGIVREGMLYGLRTETIVLSSALLGPGDEARVQCPLGRRRSRRSSQSCSVCRSLVRRRRV